MTDAAGHARAKRTEDWLNNLFRACLAVPLDDVRHLRGVLGEQDALLPMLDPTAWMRGGGKVTEVAIGMVEAFLAFRSEFDAIRERAGPRFFKEWAEFGNAVRAAQAAREAREGGP